MGFVRGIANKIRTEWLILLTDWGTRLWISESFLASSF